MKRKVMIFAGVYLPGVKGGGPIQSVKNLVDNLSDTFDFYIVTSDRDLGNTEPYNNVKINQWNQTDNARIYYIGKDRMNIKTIKEIINSSSPQTIYLNSFFSLYFSIIPVILNKFNIIKPQKLVIAPRGEFSGGALNFKTSKKKLYIKVVKALRIYKKNNLYWHLTSEIEKEDLEHGFGVTKHIEICQNFSANYEDKKFKKNIPKNKNELRLIYLGRIHPMKNLNYGINLLNNIDHGNVSLDVYGPIEDTSYWERCKDAIRKLPSNVQVSYKGLIPHDLVLNTFEKYHFFLFPTHGENFGHVISESLISATPVIISDQTPWKDLEKKQVGWDISLQNKNKFDEVLNETLSLEQNEYQIMSETAFIYAQKMAQQEDKKKKMIKILS